MATAGPNLPSTGASFSSPAWTSPGNITAEDGVFSTCVEAGSASEELKGSGFGWSIPAGSVVSNVLFEMKAKVDAGTGSGFGYVFFNGGSPDGAQASATFDTVSTWRTCYNGDPASTFDARAIANTDNYSFIPDGTAKTWSVDAYRVTITYTAPSGMPPIRISRVAVNQAASR